MNDKKVEYLEPAEAHELVADYAQGMQYTTPLDIATPYQYSTWRRLTAPQPRETRQYHYKTAPHTT